MEKITVIFSHGLEGTPYGAKARLLADISTAQGFKFIAKDYGQDTSVEKRSKMLAEIVSDIDGDIILAGSSMGGYMAAAEANETKLRGLYLLAPALYMYNYPIQDFSPKTKVITVRHGWRDTIVPISNTYKFAEANKAEMEIVDDNHRMSDTIEGLAVSYTRFLTRARGE